MAAPIDQHKRIIPNKFKKMTTFFLTTPARYLFPKVKVLGRLTKPAVNQMYYANILNGRNLGAEV